MITIKSGDILDVKEGIICQQVNHKGVMGSGLAKQIKNAYPDVFYGYYKKCNMYSFSHIRDTGLVHWFKVNDKLRIANIFGQEDYGRKHITNKVMHTDYASLRNGLKTVVESSKVRKETVYIPYAMGCGLGGGDWSVVGNMITVDYGYDLDANIVIVELNP